MMASALNAGGTAPPRPSLLRRVLHGARIVTMVVAGLAAVLFLLGFAWFALVIPRQEHELSGNADAIVVLTGGAERIADAFDLMENGRAKRLLITGVHPDTTSEDLLRRHPKAQPFLHCCVDLDRRALNTAGNALEARRWVANNRFRRVIIVTSSWHMPRALVELGRALPDVELLPYPVVAGRFGRPGALKEIETWRLLGTEYVKYLAAVVKIRVAPRVAPAEPAAAARGSRSA